MFAACAQCTDRAWHKDIAEANATRPPAAPRPAPPVLPPFRPEEAAAISDSRRQADRGLGDTVARMLGSAGEKMKLWLAERGIDCGCSNRQEWLNQRFPYRR